MFSQIFDGKGKCVRQFGVGQETTGVCCDNSGNILATNCENKCVTIYDRKGVLVTMIKTSGDAYAVCTDKFNRILVGSNQSVQVFGF